MLSCVFFFRLPHTPISTLFPYTTLFRSHAVRLRLGADPRHGQAAGGDRRGDGGDLDRKSTRLNSSHVRTSYAVFCLKKKNDKTRKYLYDLIETVEYLWLDGKAAQHLL